VALNTTQFGSVLKVFYLGPVREQLNQSSVLLSKLETKSNAFSGKRVEIPLHSDRNYGHGSRNESEALPTALRQGYSSAVFTPSYQYGSIRVTGPTIKAARDNRGAFLRAVDSEMKGMSKDLRASVNRQIFRDGSGALTACSGANSTVTINVDSTKYIKPGMTVDIIDAGTSAPIASNGTQAVATVPNATTFTVAAAPSPATADGDKVVLTGTYNKDLFGLSAIVSTADPSSGQFGQIARATNSFWQAGHLTAGSNRALTIELMQQAQDESDVNGDGDIGLIVTNHAVKRKYGQLLVSEKRYPPGGEITLDGGYSGLEFNGSLVVADKDAGGVEDPSTLNGMYFLDTSSLFFLDMGDWDWMSEDGAILSRRDGYDEYEATLFRYFQLASDQCNANTLLDNISE
tara:strand:+ start:5716 stop:6924 length:1209 start_codon:yes stop_codon:yes gene_type:complete